MTVTRHLKSSIFAVCIVLWLSALQSDTVRYEPNWASLDARPLPTWFDQGKIGIFLHWGVYSVPSYGGEWFWASSKSKNSKVHQFMEKNYKPGFTYEEFAPMFTAEFFEPEKWAQLFKKAGAKYVVLTSKHHEGYTLWPSKYSFGWNAMDVGPKRDLVADLGKAVRAHNMTYGLYYSLYEWFNRLYQADHHANFTTNEYVRTKMIPEMMEMVNQYHPSLIWADGDWEASPEYFNSTHFLAWLYNDSPIKDTVVVNGRWGKGAPGHHGGYFNYKDNYNPGTMQPHKWEAAITMDHGAWGFRREAHLADFKTPEKLMEILARTVSCGGNLLLNIGPTSDGRIIPLFEERLLQMGEWLKVNGEAIYASKPWTHQNDTINKDVWYTQRAGHVYGLLTHYHDKIEFGAIEHGHVKSVHLLGYSGSIQFEQHNKHTVVNMPHLTPLMPIKYAYVFRFELK